MFGVFQKTSLTWICLYASFKQSCLSRRTTTQPLFALSIMIVKSSLKLYNASRSFLVELLYLLEGISMSNNLSESLFLGLKGDLGLNLSVQKVRSSFLKYHIRRDLLPCSSNSLSLQFCSVYLIRWWYRFQNFEQQGNSRPRYSSSWKVNDIFANKIPF